MRFYIYGDCAIWRLTQKDVLAWPWPELRSSPRFRDGRLRPFGGARMLSVEPSRRGWPESKLPEGIYDELAKEYEPHSSGRLAS